MKYDMKACGARVQELRMKHRLTQVQLAEALNMSVSNLAKIETGYSGFSLDTLIELRSFFNVTTDYLLFGTEYNAENQIQKLQQIIDTASKLKLELGTINRIE